MSKVMLAYNIELEQETIHASLKRVINQIYKLLPLREEGQDWQKPLETIFEELVGMKELICNQEELFFMILCKMKGLFSLTSEKDMYLYRRTILEVLSLLSNLDRNVSN